MRKTHIILERGTPQFVLMQINGSDNSMARVALYLTNGMARISPFSLDDSEEKDNWRDLMFILAEKDIYGVLEAMASNPYTPPDLLCQIAEKAPPLTRMVAANPSTPGYKLMEFSKNTAMDILEAVAGNTSTPPDVLMSLLLDNLSDKVIKEIIASNPSSPESAINMLAGDENRVIKGLVAGNPSTPLPTLKSLRENSKLKRGAFLKNPDLPEEWINEIAEQQDPMFFEIENRLLAAHPRITELASKFLSHASDLQTRVNLALNPHAPPGILESLYLWQECTIEEMTALASNPSTPAHILKELSNGLAIYHLRLASNPSTPPETLEILAGDISFGHDITGVVAANPSTPPRLLEMLSNNIYAHIREGVASNPSASDSLLYKLSNDHLAKVRAAVARNPSAPINLLHELAMKELQKEPAEQMVLVLVAVASNRNKVFST